MCLGLLNLFHNAVASVDSQNFEVLSNSEHNNKLFVSFKSLLDEILHVN